MYILIIKSLILENVLTSIGNNLKRPIKNIQSVINDYFFLLEVDLF